MFKLFSSIIFSIPLWSSILAEKNVEMAQNFLWSKCERIPQTQEEFEQVCARITQEDVLLDIGGVVDLYEQHAVALLDEHFPAHKEQYFYAQWRQKVLEEIYLPFVHQRPMHENSKNLCYLSYICGLIDHVYTSKNNDKVFNYNFKGLYLGLAVKCHKEHVPMDLVFVKSESIFFGILQYFVHLEQNRFLNVALSKVDSDTNVLQVHGVKYGFFCTNIVHDLKHKEDMSILNQYLNLALTPEIKESWSVLPLLAHHALSFAAQYVGDDKKFMTAIIVPFFAIHEPLDSQWMKAQYTVEDVQGGTDLFDHLLLVMEKDGLSSLKLQLSDLKLDDYGINADMWLKEEVPGMFKAWTSYLKKEMKPCYFNTSTDH